MNITIFYTILTISLIGLASAVIIYIVSIKFKTEEDGRIDLITELLPNANCGACGYAGCRNFAENVVDAKDLSKFNCPASGKESIQKIADILGLAVVENEPMIAVVKCAGSLNNRRKISNYDGVQSCVIASNTYGGEYDCAYGCLGFGDCVKVCKFNAIFMDKTTGLPVVSEEKCVGCAACVTACPKNIIELRKKGPKSRRIFVACSNKDKGAAAKKACDAACIGCELCVTKCPFDAISVENNLAYIDFNKCRLCKKCVSVCPTGAIKEINFPKINEEKVKI